MSRFHFMAFVPRDMFGRETSNPWQEYSASFSTIEKATQWLMDGGKYLIDRFSPTLELFDKSRPKRCSCDKPSVSISNKWCTKCNYLLKGSYRAKLRHL